jgi:hypothetical protein
VLTRGLSHTTDVRSPARGRITPCVAEHHVVNPGPRSTPARAPRQLGRRPRKWRAPAPRREPPRSRSTFCREESPRALMPAHTSARNRSSLGGELALRPKRSAQAQMPPTARPVPRGEGQGLLVLAAGLVPHCYGVTHTALDRIGIHCGSCSAFGAAPRWTRASCQRDQPKA